MGVSCKILDLSILESQEVSVPFCEPDLGKHIHVALYSSPACAAMYVVCACPWKAPEPHPCSPIDLDLEYPFLCVPHRVAH